MGLASDGTSIGAGHFPTLPGGPLYRQTTRLALRGRAGGVRRRRLTRISNVALVPSLRRIACAEPDHKAKRYGESDEDHHEEEPSAMTAPCCRPDNLRKRDQDYVQRR